MALMGGDKAPCRAEVLRFEMEENVTGEIPYQLKNDFRQIVVFEIRVCDWFCLTMLGAAGWMCPSSKCLRPLTFDAVQRSALIVKSLLLWCARSSF